MHVGYMYVYGINGKSNEINLTIHIRKAYSRHADLSTVKVIHNTINGILQVHSMCMFLECKE